MFGVHTIIYPLLSIPLETAPNPLIHHINTFLCHSHTHTPTHTAPPTHTHTPTQAPATSLHWHHLAPDICLQIKRKEQNPKRFMTDGDLIQSSGRETEKAAKTKHTHTHTHTPLWFSPPPCILPGFDVAGCPLLSGALLL